MLRDTAKTAAAVAFLLLLAVPVAFFRFGYVGALREALLTIALFALTAFFGHRYVRTFLGIASPTTLDARILVGLALTTVFLAFGDIYLFLGSVTGSILSGLQFAFLTGLLSSSLKSQTGGWSSWKRGFWKRPEYIPAMILMAVVSIAMVALFWSRL